MSIYKSIIIDDDAFIRKSLQDYLQYSFPELNIVAICSDAFSGLKAIEQHQPHLVFLDIEMPGLSGFEMLNKINPIQFEIIFITSFDHYAIKAIRYSALDYLLKPIDPVELKIAIDRFKEKKSASSAPVPLLQNFISNLNAKTPDDFKLAISTTQGTLFLPIQEIIRLEADGSYTLFHLRENKKLLASRTLKDFADLLDEQRFIRVHKSHLVNRRYVRRILNTHHLLMEDNTEVEVSRRKWDDVKNILKESAE
ncbi:MAG: response regulator transcription factor [Chitinophagaceae bacterium]|nr:response regulator transcription factor [Chitinophagaceae bacterium]